MSAATVQKHNLLLADVLVGVVSLIEASPVSVYTHELSELTYAIAKADRKCGKPVRNDECIHDRYVR